MQKKHLGRMLCSFALSALTLWGVSVTTAAKDARAALRSLREESLGVMLLRYERGDGGEEYLSMQTSLALRAAPLLRGEDERIAQAWSTELTQKPDDGAAGDAQDNEGTVLTQEKTPDEVAVTENGVPARTLKASDPSGYTVFGNVYINNGSDAALDASMLGADYAACLGADEPQVLIMHTHATESYQTWPDPVFDPGYTARSKSTALNMCAVGEKMAQVLNAAGIRTLHDETLYDAPGYTDSYKRSRAGVQTYLERYPSIKVVLDVHRDAIEDSDGTRVKPVCEIDGESTAQVMVIAGCDNGSSIALPNWRLNLRFAAEWETAMESAYPGLTRPVLCGYRFYNQDLTTGSLLIEIGGHANTLDEALRAGEYAAKALAAVLGG